LKDGVVTMGNEIIGSIPEKSIVKAKETSNNSKNNKKLLIQKTPKSVIVKERSVSQKSKSIVNANETTKFSNISPSSTIASDISDISSIPPSIPESSGFKSEQGKKFFENFKKEKEEKDISSVNLFREKGIAFTCNLPSGVLYNNSTGEMFFFLYLLLI
jgi:hypothetical protein